MTYEIPFGGEDLDAYVSSPQLVRATGAEVSAREELQPYWIGHANEQEGRLTLNPAPHIDPYLTIVLPALAIPA